MKQNITKETKITKEMKIGELMINYPQAVEVLFEEGIHCLGCGAAHFESLEDGLTAHGKSEKEIEEIVKKLNKVVSNN
ncbi:MAG: DUF1858 domain-containing protein [Nanoarchaeota archaeon]